MWAYFSRLAFCRKPVFFLFFVSCKKIKKCCIGDDIWCKIKIILTFDSGKYESEEKNWRKHDQMISCSWYPVTWMWIMSMSVRRTAGKKCRKCRKMARPIFWCRAARRGSAHTAGRLPIRGSVWVRSFWNTFLKRLRRKKGCPQRLSGNRAWHDNREKSGGKDEWKHWDHQWDGSRFCLCYHDPVWNCTAAKRTAGEDFAGRRNNPGLRLLLAEDNELNEEIAEMLLTDEGAEINMVHDGRAGDSPA